MKKFFTLIAAVALAASVNAQGTYAVKVGDKVNAGDKITSVKNVTLTYMENDGTAFADGKATDNWADANNYFIDGKSRIPKLYGGFGLKADYKNVDFSVDFACAD